MHRVRCGPRRRLTSRRCNSCADLRFDYEPRIEWLHGSSNRGDRPIDITDRAELIIIHFFRKAGGALFCRVTDAITRESWFVEDALSLRTSLTRARTDGAVRERDTPRYDPKESS